MAHWRGGGTNLLNVKGIKFVGCAPLHLHLHVRPGHRLWLLRQHAHICRDAAPCSVLVFQPLVDNQSELGVAYSSFALLIAAFASSKPFSIRSRNSFMDSISERTSRGSKPIRGFMNGVCCVEEWTWLL